MRVISVAVFVLLGMILVGCSVQTQLTYQPKNSAEHFKITAEKSWNTIKVSVNDSVVAQYTMGIAEYSAAFKGSYKGYEVSVLVSYVYGFFGIGSGFDTTVLINGELAGRFKL